MYIIYRNGYLELFVTGTDGHLWYNYHKDGDSAGSWSGWRDLGGGIASAPTGIHRNGYLEIFVTGTDGHLWYKYHKDGDSAGSWSGWRDLGPGIASAPVVIHRNNYLELFAIGDDGHLWYKYHHDQADGSADSWSGWRDLGHGIASIPAVIHRNGYLEIFATGTDGHLWYKYHKDGDSAGSWSGWVDLGTGIASAPTVIHRNSYLEIFATGVDSHLWYKYHKDGDSAGSWSGWRDLGSGIASAPVVIHRNDYLELFATGMDNHLWYKYHHDQAGGSADSWSSWYDLGSCIASAPVVIHRNDYLELFATGMDNHLWYKYHHDQAGRSADNWSGWRDLGHGISIDYNRILVKLNGSRIVRELHTETSGVEHLGIFGIVGTRVKYDYQNKVLNTWKPVDFARVADWIYDEDWTLPNNARCLETLSFSHDIKYGYICATVDGKNLNILAIRGTDNKKNAATVAEMSGNGVIPPLLKAEVELVLSIFKKKYGPCNIAVGHSLGGKLLEVISGKTILGISFNSYVNYYHENIIAFRTAGDIAGVTIPNHTDRGISALQADKTISMVSPVIPKAHKIRYMVQALEQGCYGWRKIDILMVNKILPQFNATKEDVRGCTDTPAVPDLKTPIEKLISQSPFKRWFP